MNAFWKVVMSSVFLDIPSEESKSTTTSSLSGVASSLLARTRARARAVVVFLVSLRSFFCVFHFETGFS